VHASKSAGVLQAQIHIVLNMEPKKRGFVQFGHEGLLAVKKQKASRMRWRLHRRTLNAESMLHADG